MVKRVTSIPMLYDIEARVRMMDQWPAYQPALDGLALAEDERAAIYFRNALRMLKIEPG